MGSNCQLCQRVNQADGPPRRVLRQGLFQISPPGKIGFLVRCLMAKNNRVVVDYSQS